MITKNYIKDLYEKSLELENVCERINKQIAKSAKCSCNAFELSITHKSALFNIELINNIIDYYKDLGFDVELRKNLNNNNFKNYISSYDLIIGLDLGNTYNVGHIYLFEYE